MPDRGKGRAACRSGRPSDAACSFKGVVDARARSLRIALQGARRQGSGPCRPVGGSVRLFGTSARNAALASPGPAPGARPRAGMPPGVLPGLSIRRPAKAWRGGASPASPGEPGTRGTRRRRACRAARTCQSRPHGREPMARRALPWRGMATTRVRPLAEARLGRAWTCPGRLPRGGVRGDPARPFRRPGARGVRHAESSRSGPRENPASPGSRGAPPDSVRISTIPDCRRPACPALRRPAPAHDPLRGGHA